MSEKRFKKMDTIIDPFPIWDTVEQKGYNCTDTLDLLVDFMNEQQELIEELHISDEMGWKRAEKFEKKCPKELHNKKMYIKRLEYKVQKFKEENEQLREEYAESLADEVKKNGLLNEEINQLRIENMRLKKKVVNGV